MGSATREALAASKQVLDATGSVDLTVAAELFQVGRVVGDSLQLRSLLHDSAIPAATKSAIVERVFGDGTGETTRSLVSSLVTARWSSAEDLLEGIEDLALRASAVATGDQASIASELFAFGRVVSSDAQLELALGTKLGRPEAKGVLVSRLLDGKASPATVTILSALVQQPRGRRIGELLRHAARVVADQKGQTVATVTSAVPLGEQQLERLRSALSASYGRNLTINEVVDPAVIGGLRIQVADDVIDGSVSTRLGELRRQLAG
ncbi:F0F1 ATP synthase subunit delta [Labedella populi]|uniref:ATP synthase subunit delta n=1 Tax=Labedella populi TaxID=2498850 RepID=A0A444QGF1_9MICO|nr:F0F1 ATP synthase subunit delta [Labedella populi]RWZ68663.1 F0F1 ATP synthase subunit delta [Labedella populi]